MEQDAVKSIKQALQCGIAENEAQVYVEFCRLLEYFLKQVIARHYNADFADSLTKMLQFVCDKISFPAEERERLQACIHERNKHIHQPAVPVRLDRTVIRRGCYAYNALVEAVKRVYPDVGYIFLLDKGIFDIDFIFIDQTQQPGKNNAYDFLREATIRDIEKTLKELEDQGKKNTEEYRDNSYLLFLNYKAHLPFRINWKGRLEKLPPKRVREFSFHLGVNDSDYGFDIIGIRAANYCKNPDRFLYSVIYGILNKGRCYCPSRFIAEKVNQSGIKYNMKFVLRYEMLILAMIRHNYFDRTLEVNVIDGTAEEFELAFSDIVHYLTLLSALQKKTANIPLLRFSEKGVTVSVKNSGAEIYILDKKAREEEAADCLWTERTSAYKIDEQDKEIIDELSQDLFGFSLKEDQRRAVIQILNGNRSNMCLMPTGYGKSAIFYFAAFLRSGITVVVAPTDALIQDQLRNLQSLHGITCAAQYDVRKDFEEYSFYEKLVYIKADVILNRTFVLRIAELANDGIIDRIVLDEVHSLSLWSHEFRPAYIMLAQYLDSYLPGVPTLSFTATASAKVVLDLKARLHLENEDIIESASLKRGDIRVEIIENDSVEQNYETGAKLIEKLEAEKARSLVFVKNEKQARRLRKCLDNIGCNQVDYLLDYREDTFRDFINQNTNTLVVGHDMGVGINLPNVNCCIHIGYPVSVSQFVQEAGRVAREEGASGSAYLVVQDYDKLQDWEKELLSVGTSVDEVIAAVQSSEDNGSDIVDIYRSVFDYLDNNAKTFAKVSELSDRIIKQKDVYRLYFYPVHTEKDKKIVQFYMVLLSRIGILKEWYYTEEGSDVVSFAFDRFEDLTLASVKERTLDSMRKMGGMADTQTAVKRAESITDVILQYIEWYYNEYLLNQREQLVNLVQAIDEGDIIDYFEVGIGHLQEIGEEAEGKTMEELLVKHEEFFDKKRVRAMKKLCEISQNVKYDLFLLWSAGIKERGDFAGRWQRVTAKFGSGFIKEKYRLFARLYENCSASNRKIIINTLLPIAGARSLLSEFYADLERDEIFYSILISEINSILEASYGKGRN